MRKQIFVEFVDRTAREVTDKKIFSMIRICEILNSEILVIIYFLLLVLNSTPFVLTTIYVIYIQTYLLISIKILFVKN